MVTTRVALVALIVGVGFAHDGKADEAMSRVSAPAPGFRLAVLLQPGGELATSVAAHASSYAMRELASAGFSVIDPASIATVRDTWSLAKLDAGTIPRGLSAIDADVVVFVTLSAASQGRVRPESSFLSVRVAMETRWLEIETGRVVGGAEVVSTGFGLDEATGAQDGAKRAAAALAAKVRDGLGALEARARKLDVMVESTASESALPAVTAALGSLDGVSGVVVAVRSAEVNRLSLEYSRGDGLALARAIDASAAMPVLVVQATKAAVVVRYAPMRASRISTDVVAALSSRAGGWGWLQKTLPDIVATHLSNNDYLDVAAGRRAGSVLHVQGSIKPRDARRAQVTLSAVGADRSKLVAVSAEVEAATAATQLSDLSQQLVSALDARVRDKPTTLTQLPRRGLAEDQRDLRVAAVQVETLMPAKLAAYAKEGIVKVHLENAGKVALDKVSATVFIPGLMRLPSQTQVGSLPAGAKRVVALPAVLDAEALAKRTQQATVQMAIEAEGRRGDAWLTARRVAGAVVLEASAIDWTDTASAAAFVTPAAEAIQQLLGAASGAGAEDLPPELYAPLVAVESLAALQLAYRPDSSNRARANRLDQIQLPSQTLTVGSGDCDDLTVLLASLLEAMGNRVVLLATPGHLLLAASTGVASASAEHAPYAGQGWFVHEGQLWVPLESTKVAQGFAATWTAGKREVQRKPLEVVDVGRAWQRFPPVPFVTQGAARSLDAAALAKRIGASSLSLVQQWRAGQQGELERAKAAQLARPNDASSLVDLGRALGRAGRLEEAVAALEQAVGKAQANKESAVERVALELLGTAHASRGELEQARKTLERAAKLGALSGAGSANLVLLQVAGGNAAAARQTLKTHSPRDGLRALARVARGPARGGGARAASGSKAPKVDKRDLRQVVDEVLEALPPSDPTGAPYIVLPMGGSRGAGVDEELVTMLVQWP